MTTYGGFLLSKVMNDEKKQLEQERNELNTLINKGVSFELKDTEFEVKKKVFRSDKAVQAQRGDTHIQD